MKIPFTKYRLILIREHDSNDIIDDGFGNQWSAYCAMCGRKSMQIVRPGKVQCKYCG